MMNFYQIMFYNIKSYFKIEWALIVFLVLTFYNIIELKIAKGNGTSISLFEGSRVVFSDIAALSIKNWRAVDDAGLPSGLVCLVLSLEYFVSVSFCCWSLELQGCFSRFSQASPEETQEAWKAKLENLVCSIQLYAQDLKTFLDHWDLVHLHLWVRASGLKTCSFLVNFWLLSGRLYWRL